MGGVESGPPGDGPQEASALDVATGCPIREGGNDQYIIRSEEARDLGLGRHTIPQAERWMFVSDDVDGWGSLEGEGLWKT